MRQVGKDATAVETYFVDVAKLKGSEFDARVKLACERHVAASTNLIVHPDDPSSAQLAADISAKYAPTGAETPINALILSKRPADSVKGGVLVVAGCVGSGGCLQSISRDLRDPAGDEPRTYLVGAAKHPHHPRHESLRGDLVYSSTDHEHIIVILEELTLPDRHIPSAWEAELAILNSLIGPELNSTMDASVKDTIEGRIAHIHDLANSVDTFFWPAPVGTALTLRKTFAFWDGVYDANRASHGDILFTVACVLENLRDGPSPRLHRTAFQHGFIAPSTFGRYNDGIIQGAFLRAATPSELDYSGDEDASLEMSRLLARLFSEWASPRGEATIEFLVSIMCGRMRLRAADLMSCLGALDGTSPLLATFRARCEALTGE